MDPKKIRDTLPFDKARDYYPQGFPLDYDGQYTPVTPLDERCDENPPAQATKIYQQRSTESTSEQRSTELISEQRSTELISEPRSTESTSEPRDRTDENIDDSTDGTNFKKIRDTLPFEKARHYYPHGFPLNFTGQYTPVDKRWYENLQARVTERSSESASERKDRINQNFYAGTEGLVKDIGQVIRDHDRRFSDNKVGVIGQGREKFQTSSTDEVGSNGKVQPPFLTVAESNSIEDQAHAEPLLNMAFATLLTHKKEKESDAHGKSGERSDFVAADPAWIDKSEEGNKSFFDAPKAMAPKTGAPKKKKKKVVRRPFLSY
ncbi:hypothetical protein B0T26DRAFT_756726 [Lasiosphaeria miniovina]|uniref:Uncharacterized protein n=1 Tax=Lasiosphaeria miniovina TaxID=1954250 RepID=A0AA40DJM4_9PEZI|nr:uncharacterized protein B0T26DRAFT_756726 [Lasiosphaeria miniovina]KAK0703162.1 hypothetical protein B0T26DRAFT_756726 [Lasiosphaeria miniovina]